MSAPSRRVLVCEDRQKNYDLLSTYLDKEGFICDPRMERYEDVRARLLDSYGTRSWYSFVMIDIDLSGSGEKASGIDCYQMLSAEFPNEAYIIYTTQDIEPVRREINRLRYRDNVELVLLDHVLKRENIRFYLERIVRERYSNRVFLVHGRNRNKAAQLSVFLRRGLGLDVVDWRRAAGQVKTARKTAFDIVLTGVEISWCTVALFTDDEEVILRKEYQVPGDIDGSLAETNGPIRRRQARPNVYIEAGYAFGKRPGRTIFVEWPDREEYFERPSNFGGYHSVSFDGGAESREDLRNALESARCALQQTSRWQTIKLRDGEPE